MGFTREVPIYPTAPLHAEGSTYSLASDVEVFCGWMLSGSDEKTKQGERLIQLLSRNQKSEMAAELGDINAFFKAVVDNLGTLDINFGCEPSNLTVLKTLGVVSDQNSRSIQIDDDDDVDVGNVDDDDDDDCESSKSSEDDEDPDISGDTDGLCDYDKRELVYAAWLKSKFDLPVHFTHQYSDAGGESDSGYSAGDIYIGFILDPSTTQEKFGEKFATLNSLKKGNPILKNLEEPKLMTIQNWNEITTSGY